MSLQDPIADCLTRIRNGLMRGKTHVEVPFSKLKYELISVLVSEGYLKSCKESESDSSKQISVELKYFNEMPVIKEIKRISKPGRRVYSRATSIPKVMNGLGLAILSTPKGVMSDTEARKNNIGGEIICKVF